MGSELSDVSEPPTTTSPASGMSGYKTRSDSLMLMRQIKSLKDLGSNLGGDLETSSRTFLSGVQIVRTGNKPQVTYDSDNEEDNEQLQCVEYIQHQQKVLTGATATVTSNQSPRSAKEEDVKKQKLDDDEARRKAAEDARNQAIEEARRKRQLDEEARRKQQEEEESRRKQIEDERRRKALEEEEKRRQALEEEKMKREREDELRRKLREEEMASRKKEEDR